MKYLYLSLLCGLFRHVWPKDLIADLKKFGYVCMQGEVLIRCDRCKIFPPLYKFPDLKK